MVDAGVIATLQEGNELPSLFSTFLMPSHLVWLAQRRYIKNNADPEVILLARRAIDGRDRLSPAGKVEACRLLCLSAARLARDNDFQYAIGLLRSGGALAPWQRSNLNFLLGFNARMHGNLPEAERYFRLAYDDSPRNFQAARELAAICLARGNSADAEKFAREAYRVAEDSAYILDIMLSVLIRSDRARVKAADAEIQMLFHQLRETAAEDGRSFYTTRRAEYELRWGSIDVACTLIDEAVNQSPWIFNVHELRAEIYLEKRNYSVAYKEIQLLRGIVHREGSGERFTNLRAYLTLMASYEAATGNYDTAKEIYRTRNVFTAPEAQDAIKKIEIEQIYRRQK